MPRILITGGNGFIGQHLIKKLVTDSENEIINIDIKPALFDYSNKVTNVQADIRNSSTFRDLVKVDEVYHLAAQTSSILSEQDPQDDITTNILGTLNICEYALRSDSLITFASSMAIYGNGNVHVETPPSPKSTYGITKLAAEQLVRKFFSASGRYRISRLFNVYGPGQDLQNLNQGMLSIFSAMAISQNAITVKGSKARTRDFIHVSDVVDHWISGQNFAQISNVGTGKSTSVEQLVSMIQNILKPNTIPIIYETGFREDVDTIRCLDPVIKGPISLSNFGLNEFIEWAKGELTCM
ncbi:NAD-dependent epimerase/dehydratase family protein [Alphaproteobacteria bacterium US3C007]|nr:NAD-dependent epimerase/dehydratase family protein [Alphaproteobacteria bacterium US3C007]